MQGSLSDWDDARLFLALARARTLGEAAARLGVDSSTVSRRLSALEEELATQLFDRSRDGVLATPAAEALMPIAEELELVMARFSGTAEGFDQAVEGTVRISCPPDVAEVLIVPRLSALRERYPRLRLQLDAGERLVDVSRRATELALRVVRPTQSDLVATRVGAVRWVPAIAAPHCPRDPLRQWHALPWVGFGEGLAHTPVARWQARYQSETEVVVRTDSLRLQIALVAEGLGAALLPAGSVRHYGLRALRLNATLSEELAALPAQQLYLVTHRALRQVPRVRAVWDVLRAAAHDVLQGA